MHDFSVNILQQEQTFLTIPMYLKYNIIIEKNKYKDDSTLVKIIWSLLKFWVDHTVQTVLIDVSHAGWCART